MSANISPNEVPFIRVALAKSQGVDKNLLFVVGGGLGDKACAEPTIRFAIESFNNCEISLCCETPEIFQHLQFKDIFTHVDHIKEGKYLPLYTYPQGLAAQFMSANFTNGVDFASISALRRQLNNYDRMIMIDPPRPREELRGIFSQRYCLVHVGKGWPSKTFPIQWWNKITSRLLDSGVTPILIGQNCLEVDNSYCIDLRDQTSVNELMWICKNTDFLITNDSAPLHFAAAGRGRIAFIPSCKNPGFLDHVSRSVAKPFYKTDLWNRYPSCPNLIGLNSIAELPPDINFDDLLPEPLQVVQWVLDAKSW